MRHVVRCAVAMALVAAPTVAVEAQNSVFGVRGIGFPGRPISARARALGGAPAVFDRSSAVNPAAAVGFPQVAVIAVAGTEYREYEVGDEAVDGLRATRFPLALVGGRVRPGVGFAFSFASYAERSFDVTSSDTVLLRNEQVAIADRVRSSGGLVDLRAAVAWAPSSRWWLGVAGHLIGGSTTLRAQRDFGDSAYRSFRRETRASFSGAGVSVGAIVNALPGLRLGLAGRFDTRLRSEVDSTDAGRTDLPVSLTAGVELAPAPALRLTAAAAWRSWSDASTDLAATGESAFDTWELNAGVEIGGWATGASRVPLRVGLRYAQLPFAPGADQPREIDLALGTGLVFASNRALIDLTLERALRDGAGVRERAWQVSASMTVRP